MNQQQKNYIKRRVTDILNLKMSEARAKFTTKSKPITNSERVELIISGKAKVKPAAKLRKLSHQYGNLMVQNVFDFSKYETVGKFDQIAYNKYLKKVRAKANEITDKVMLGDAEEALRMIRDFEEFEG